MRALQNKTIGLVLPSTPGYSETFFRSKIAGLQQNGAKVIVFAGNSNKTDHRLTCEISYAPKLNGNIVFVAINSMIELLKAFLFNYKTSVRYLALEKKEGSSFKTRIKNLIANTFILRHKTDWLHYGFGTMALGRENIAQATGARMAVSFRGFDHYVYPLKYPKCYARLFNKDVKYHVLSEGMRQSLEIQGIPKQNIYKITPAINTSEFAKSSNKTTTNHVVTVARLHWIKGLEYILEALSILKKQGVDFNYTIIGEGIERERLLFAAYQLGIENNVKFAGKLPHSEVKIHLEQAAIYLQYSIQEGFCNAVLEAQAMGLLCIVSDAEGLSENVLHNQTGWVVPKRKPELLAEKIREVLAMNTVQKDEITAKAIQRVKDEFNVEKQTQEFVEFYKL